MPDDCIRRVAMIFAILTFAMAIEAMARGMEVKCTSCKTTSEDQSVDLILRENADDSITLRWQSDLPPVPSGFVATVYGGNPVHQQDLVERGRIDFVEENGKWFGTMSFDGRSVGGGTFITVLTLRREDAKKTSGSDNSNLPPRTADEQILDWRAFRLLTLAELEDRSQLPEPQGKWSIDVRPALLRVTTGHGDLPRSRAGGTPVWWAIGELEGNTSDLDIDGDHSGVPGLMVQVSTPWHTRAESDWKEGVLNKLTGVEGHKVHFGELTWYEIKDREIPIQDKQLVLRHYYTVVTLFTNASAKSFNQKEVGVTTLFTSPVFFSHETTARLKHPGDPRFWSSYSLRDYGADPWLLDLLKRQVQRDGSVPGLGPVQVDDGDGGTVGYDVGFYARVRPWDPPEEQAGRKFNAGFVGLDVVAARAGYGGIVVKGDQSEPALPGAWCEVVRCDDQGKDLNLSNPPSGFRTYPPVAALATLSGSLPMIDRSPKLAERGLNDLPELPATTRFGLTANLRAGALAQTAAFGNVKNLVPINSYAQFVLKMTVAMLPTTVAVASNEAVLPAAIEFKTHTETPKPGGLWGWITEHLGAFLGAIVAVAVVLAVIFLPGVRQFVSSIFRLLAALINRLAGRIEKK